VTDALVRTLPAQLDVALAVHGGSVLHTFTEFTSNPNTLRDRAASITCRAGCTRLLAILKRAIAVPGVRVVTYVGDVYEESPGHGRRLEVGPVRHLHSREQRSIAKASSIAQQG
jgi:hypothetical protein